LIRFAKNANNLIIEPIKKYQKILLKLLKYIVLFLLLIIILLSTSYVQTKLAKYATIAINEDFGTDLLIQKVDLSFLGTVQLKGIEIRDHHKDTLIFVNKLSTSLLNAKKILDREVKLKSISIEDAHFHMKTYKDEQDDNLTVFIDSFDTDIPKDSLRKRFILETSNIYFSN